MVLWGCCMWTSTHILYTHTYILYTHTYILYTHTFILYTHILYTHILYTHTYILYTYTHTVHTHLKYRNWPVVPRSSLTFPSIEAVSGGGLVTLLSPYPHCCPGGGGG